MKDDVEMTENNQQGRKSTEYTGVDNN